MRPNAQHRPPGIKHASVANTVTLTLRMLASVDLHHKLQLTTCKICKIAVYRMLANELVPTETAVAQFRPDRGLGIVILLTKQS